MFLSPHQCVRSVCVCRFPVGWRFLLSFLSPPLRAANRAWASWKKQKSRLIGFFVLSFFFFATPHQAFSSNWDRHEKPASGGFSQKTKRSQPTTSFRTGFIHRAECVKWRLHSWLMITWWTWWWQRYARDPYAESGKSGWKNRRIGPKTAVRPTSFRSNPTEAIFHGDVFFWRRNVTLYKLFVTSAVTPVCRLGVPIAHHHGRQRTSSSQMTKKWWWGRIFFPSFVQQSHLIGAHFLHFHLQQVSHLQSYKRSMFCVL